MLVAAVVPHPPLLVPALGVGAAAQVAPLLAACDAAVAELVDRSPETVVCVGAGRRTARHGSGAWGTLAGFGVAVEAPTRHQAGPPHLPLSLTIGRWLLERAGWHGPVELQELAPDAGPEACAVIGRQLAARGGPRAAWLVLGDGSARRDERAPGAHDPRAARFDAEVARAFAEGDPKALATLEEGLAAELMVAGRPAWQVLAGAVAGRSVAAAEVRYDDAPFGVGYLVASWAVAE